MNKTAIKKFAVESRQKLIKSVIECLEELGITDKEVVELVELGGVYTIKTQTLTESQKKNRDTIIQKIQEKGYEPFVEEIAYTWFNRIIAIRYMEVNDYLPFRTRVLSSDVPGKVDPDIITEIADHIEELELNRDKVIELKEHNRQEELFKYVFIKVCNYFGQVLPVMFEQIEDYTELLLPSVMISNGSVIKDMIELVPEEDWTNQVEIIGWLYQYYISEKKDQVFADLKKNKKITKENIPAATQLFTPEWIVKYMVENSLGRLWLEGHPNEDLKSKWKYYLEESEQEDIVKSGLEKIKKEKEILTPEDLTLIDPAMGSGHILVYAFDVLYQIYQSVGYSEKEIPRLILEKNIYGLDIDDRARQLAYFALIMKARSYSRRLFKDIERNSIQINIFSIQDSTEITKKEIKRVTTSNILLERNLTHLVNSFVNAKEFGSLIEVDSLDLDYLTDTLSNLTNKELILFDNNEILIKLNYLLKQAALLSKKYDVCVSNPPYKTRSDLSPKLDRFIQEKYKDYKNDLYTAFIKRCISLTKKNGYTSMITQSSFLFKFQFKPIRMDLLKNVKFENLVKLGAGTFDEIKGEVVQSVIFTIKNWIQYNYKLLYLDLTQYKSTNEKEDKFISFAKSSNKESCMVGKLECDGDCLLTATDSNLKREHIETKIGSQPGSNLIRYWWEQKLDFPYVKYNKGGLYRKWYGNNLWVLKYGEDGEFVRKNNGNLSGKDYYFKPHISWTRVSSRMNLRYYEECAFDNTSPAIVTNQLYLLGYYNSIVAEKNRLEMYQGNKIESGHIKSIAPLVLAEVDIKERVEQLVSENIEISRYDWDLSEISYNFKKNGLLIFKSDDLEMSFKNYSLFLVNQTQKLKTNEEELNRIFIKAYNFEEKLSSEINLNDIKLKRGDFDEEIKSFISYAVGCIMGRYSLDEEGLIFAGGDFDESKYQTFKADEDGIILISDTEYFEDDLLNRFVAFVKVVYGEETLEENLNFIADTECFKRKSTESSRDCLRRYFLKGFMEDHSKVYQRRPIYWMFDSGKQNGFKALIYMYRYNEDMVAKVRTDYLHPLQRKYEAELERLDHLINFDNISASEKGKAKKLQEKLHKQLDECTQYDLLLAHVAHQRIPLDLDDGVKVNYQKFQNIELTTDSSSNSKKGDLLYKVKM